MAHFSSALWIDLSKGALTGEVAAAMQRHLAQHCPACVESYRQGAAHQESSTPVTLVFDTFQQALPAGIRSGALRSRHLLYRIDDVTTDLRLEAGARTERLLLIGQVAYASRQAEGPGPVRVAVVSGANELLSLDANELGEFQCEFDRREDLALSVTPQHRPVIVIPLDRLPEPSSPAWGIPAGQG